MQVNEETRDITAQNLRDDISGQHSSPLESVVWDKDRPQCFCRRKAFEQGLGDGDGWVEVTPRGRAAHDDGHSNTHRISQADRERCWSSIERRNPEWVRTLNTYN